MIPAVSCYLFYLELLIKTQISDNSPTNNQLIQMTTSLIENIKSQGIMTQSLDPTILSSPNSKNLINTVQQENMVKQQAMQISQYNGIFQLKHFLFFYFYQQKDFI